MRQVGLNCSKAPEDVSLIIAGCQYYIRAYSDGTFDVMAPNGGRIVGLGAIGLDGISTGIGLAVRVENFTRAHPDAR